MTTEIQQPIVQNWNISKFIKGEPVLENLERLSYPELYQVHTRQTLNRIQTRRKQRGFGVLTVDQAPNTDGVASMHLAPYGDMSQSPDDGVYRYKHDNDPKKMLFMITEDYTNLFTYYSTESEAVRPRILQAQTHVGLAGHLLTYGFQLVARAEDTEHGLFPKVEISFADALGIVPRFTAMNSRLTSSLAREYGLTPEAIRIDAIKRS